ncbi:MAG: hypothetical protein GY822_27270 [Deltaproteobacteria bacterium]|nr:hypothetical protein [Deltaproteobacteria bacterium]
MAAEKRTRRTIGITCGCPLGIGPQIAAEAMFEQGQKHEAVRFRFYAPFVLLEEAISFRKDLFVEHLSNRQARIFRKDSGESRDVVVECLEMDDGFAGFSSSDEHALRAQRHSLLRALEDAQERKVVSLVTAPIRKSCLDDVDGRDWPGHTELLGHRLGDGREPLMLFAGGPFLLGLCTVHLPICEVSTSLSVERVQHSLERMREACELLFASEGKTPGVTTETMRLVVLGLNPHAGENGRLGTEEQNVIQPGIDTFLENASSRKGEDILGVEVKGPMPADGFFGHFHRQQMPHGVLAMYHDQGLAPYKLLSRGCGVNITIGLKVPRTSPDHGTADAMRAGGDADPQSMSEALRWAIKLTT